MSANGISVTNNVAGLFLKSYYDNPDTKGYYFYDGSLNSATLGSNGKFTVYEQISTPNTGNNFFYQRGNFMPYNEPDTSNISNINLYDYLGNLRDDTDDRKGEPLYGYKAEDQNGNSTPIDFHFGMYLETKFSQPKGGIVNENHMTFEFTGDDDMWVFIDNKLVLDLGGIHDAHSGSIDFSTGKVTYPDSNVTTKYLSDLIGSENVLISGHTFTNYSSHVLKMFYMERGAGASNLRIKFNLPTIPDGNVDINKEVTNLNSVQDENKSYLFRFLTSSDNGSTYEVKSNTPYKLYDSNGNEIKDNDYTTDTNGNFYLKDKQKARFAVKDGTKYQVEELTPDGCDVTFNDVDSNKETAIETINGKEYTVYTSSSTLEAGDINEVYCNNNYQNVTGSLSVTKEFKNIDNNTTITAPSAFKATFDLYELVDDNGEEKRTKVATASYPSDFNNNSHTFSDLLLGTTSASNPSKKYEVVETVDSNGDTSDLEFKNAVYLITEPLQVTKNQVATQTVTNNYGAPIKGITIVKKNQDGTHTLSGAEFEIYEAEDSPDSKTLTTYQLGPKVSGTLQVGDNGQVIFSADQTKNAIKMNKWYYLKETKAPLGYYLPDKVIAFELTSSGLTVKNANTDATRYYVAATGTLTEGVYTLTVKDSSGAKLPNSGGPGTTLFTMLGILLMAMAGMVYRKSKLEERRQEN